MREIIMAMAITFNVILFALFVLIIIFKRNNRNVTPRYYVFGMTFTLINMIAIFYGGHI